jgi:hypothetical protein
MTLPTAIPPQVRSFSRKAYQHDSACFMQRPSAHMMRHGPRARTKGAIPSATTQLQLRVNPTTAAAMPVTARPCGDRIQERSLRWVVGRSPLCTASGLPVQQFISFVISVLIDHMGYVGISSSRRFGGWKYQVLTKNGNNLRAVPFGGSELAPDLPALRVNQSRWRGCRADRVAEEWSRSDHCTCRAISVRVVHRTSRPPECHHDRLRGAGQGISAGQTSPEADQVRAFPSGTAGTTSPIC